MTDIQFDEEQEYPQSVVPQQQSALIRLVLATGIVKNEASARYVLIGISAAAFIATGFVLMS
ncbi:MAG: hypothetical protein Q7R58_00035 [bacterium]|nr:hypothetical protein [bacterium]